MKVEVDVHNAAGGDGEADRAVFRAGADGCNNE